METAIRETEEESGFVIDKDYTVVKDFKVEAKYKVSFSSSWAKMVRDVDPLVETLPNTISQEP